MITSLASWYRGRMLPREGLFHFAATALCISAASLMMGCAPTPQKVCEQERQVYTAAGKPQTDKGQQECVERMEKQSKEKPEYFKCNADCAKWHSKDNGKDADGLMNCHESCNRQFAK